ncbi:MULTISPECIES: sensor histidine kinase [Rhizobiaceae]|uniref:histidine kinase n=1 Tax=Peteryoungia algae TaxID=2919917 RepID=A0ABT0CY74_9HYPH|nr:MULTISPECIES: sensor histidine kinase [unclassified Rhizobium]MCC8932628.1 sensor histidine kinase [Rhizobium sp. 'Codium 1']MCJ8238083.1 sensor histidine kinase [Rhizobium sp. SSM4.3]
MVHRLTWFEPQRGDEQLREFFITALIDMGASLILQDKDGTYVCITSLPARWRLAPGTIPSDSAVFGPEIGQKLADLKSGLVKAGDRAELEIEAGDDTFFEFRCRMVEMTDHDLHLITVVIDRTEDRRRERLLRALLREVSHRSKNLLAIIQSIASQTARYSGTLDMFLGKFRGRLHALSQSQDLITDSSWRGAYFRDLLKQQVDRYVQENADLVKVSGDDVLLTPNASLHIGLALHELVVNAVSHGDFLQRRQPIEVSCEKIDTKNGPAVVIIWTEPFTPRADEEAKAARFGSTVLERVVPSSVNGEARHELSDGRVRYELRFPLEIFD